MKHLKLFEEFHSGKAPDFMNLSDFLDEMDEGYPGYRVAFTNATKIISETIGLPYSDIVAVADTMFEDMGAEDDDFKFFDRTLDIVKISKTSHLAARDEPLMVIRVETPGPTRHDKTQVHKIYDGSDSDYNCCVWYSGQWDPHTEVYFFSGYYLAERMIASGDFARYLGASNVREFIDFIGRFLPDDKGKSADEILHKYRGSISGSKYRV